MIQSAEEFKKLRESNIKEEYDRASNEDAPLEVWWDIIQNYPELNEWVIHNKTIPIEILYYFAKSKEKKYRFAVATKRKLTQEIFDLLSSDIDESIRMQIVLNKKTPEIILRSMLEDTNKEITNQIKNRLKSR